MSSAKQKGEQSLMEPLVTAAGILGTIQGFLWMVLSLLVILLHSGAYNISLSDNLVGVELGATIFKGYIDKNFANPIKDDIIIKQDEFSYFMYLYMVLSFGLLVISSVILLASFTGKGEKFYDKMIVSWTVVMGLLILLDVILLCLIASDYTEYKKHIKKLQLTEEKHTVVLTAVVVVMTAAARGYVLWIINVVFAAILGKYYHSMLTKGVPRNQPAIDAYSAGSPPWPPSSIFGGDSNGASEFDNKGFRNDNDIAPFPPAPAKSIDNWNARSNYYNTNNRDRGNDQSRQQQIPMAKINRQNNNNNNWNDRNQDRTNNISPSRSYPDQDPYSLPTYPKIAKIGRQGGQRSPPLSVAPPAIPEPDYDSPPGSPRVRGVLRPKSNYLY